MYNTTEKILRHKQNNLKLLNTKLLDLQLQIENELFLKNWTKRNDLYLSLKKIKKKIKNLELHFEKNKQSDLKKILISKPKIKEWYESYPHYKTEFFLAIISNNVKVFAKIYTKLRNSNFKYMHVQGFKGGNLFILGHIQSFDIYKLGSFCLIFSKFMSLNYYTNPVIFTDKKNISKLKNKILITQSELYSCNVDKLYLKYDALKFTLEYVLKKENAFFILVQNIMISKEKLIYKIVKKINKVYNVTLDTNYLLKILPNKMDIDEDT